MTKLAGLLAGIFLLVSAPAHAVTFFFTDGHCTGGCGGTSPYGSITLTDTVAGVDISVTALGTNLLNFNGGGGLNTFSWSGTAGLTSASITNLTSGFAFVAPNPNQDGFGDFAYGVNHTANGTGTSFGFTILGWNFSDFAKSVNGGASTFFALDIFVPSSGKTGLVGATNVDFNPLIPQVPIPGAVWLFGSGIVGLVALSRRRKQRQQLEQSVA